MILYIEHIVLANPYTYIYICEYNLYYDIVNRVFDSDPIILHADREAICLLVLNLLVQRGHEVVNTSIGCAFRTVHYIKVLIPFR